MSQHYRGWLSAKEYKGQAWQPVGILSPIGFIESETERVQMILDTLPAMERDGEYIDTGINCLLHGLRVACEEEMKRLAADLRATEISIAQGRKAEARRQKRIH